MTIAVIAFLAAVWMAGGILASPHRQPVGKIPVDLNGQDIKLSSQSGSDLSGWWAPKQEGKGTVILLHGVRSTRLSMVERARFLSHAGYGTLLIDLQAHGESTGQHITFGYLESRDAAAAVNFLRRHNPTENIAIIGVSLGGAAALLATPPLEVNALVLESVYPTLEEATANRLAIRLGRWAKALTPLLTLSNRAGESDQNAEADNLRDDRSTHAS
jgi:pimeloyl-ACP methyl ester carboxylesterase